jgi:hypothetical protein
LLAIIKAALIAIPEISKGLKAIGDNVRAIQDARDSQQLAQIKDRLNVLTKNLHTATDKSELADIIRDLNSL